MTLPGYDAWRLQGPPEDPDPVMVPCECCKGAGIVTDADGPYSCPEGGGLGEVEAEPEEPDGDYEYERRRDAIMDRG